VPEDAADAVKQRVEAELQAEIARQNVDGVAVVRDVVVITVVGGGMRGTPGVAGRVFTVMGDQLINVLAFAQGSSECSISFVVDEHNLERAVVALHDLALEALPA
jgi:aspartate kinase